MAPPLEGGEKSFKKRLTPGREKLAEVLQGRRGAVLYRPRKRKKALLLRRAHLEGTPASLRKKH